MLEWFTEDVFAKCMPGCPDASRHVYYPYLKAAMEEGDITNYKRVAAFLAEISTESGQLKYWVEFEDKKNNPNFIRYETGNLAKVLGNTTPGDGLRFRGRGILMTTGRFNYRAAGKAIGVDLENNPERAAQLDCGFRTAVFYWNSKKLNDYADKFEFDTVSFKINGGRNGRDSRNSYYVVNLPILFKAESEYKKE